MNAATKKSLLHVAFTSNATAQQPPLNDATGYATPTQQIINKPISLLELARNKLCNSRATTSRKSMQQAPKKQREDVACSEHLSTSHQEEELRRLVRLVSNHHGFSQEDYEEALEVALRDPINALTCFTSLAHKAGLL
jgi:hypothetical protein